MKRTWIWAAAAILQVAACAGTDEADLGPDAELLQQLTSGPAEATLVLTSHWGSGYCADVFIRNGGSSPITSWSVDMDFNESTVNSLWNGRLSGQRVTPETHNRTIAPNARVSFGFCANGSSRARLVALQVIGGGSGGSGGSGGTSASGGAPGNGGASTGGGTGAGASSSGGSSSTCTDVPPSSDYTCAQQAQWGKCGEPWMAGHCNASCGRCSGPAGSCGVSPVARQSSESARKVLCYLYQIRDRSVLSGQQDCHWSASSDIRYIYDRTGEYPAIVGGDFLYTNAVDQAVSSWNAGGLSLIRYHMGRPEDADSYESSLGTTNLADTLTPGTSRHNGLLRKFDHAARELERLRDRGVVVLWAPFHEAQPNGWFWWSKGTGQQYVQLWQLMFDYLNARGLDNLIWVMPFSNNPSSSFLPPRHMMDIAGSDTYASGQPFAQLYQTTRSIVGNSMPIPLHETGTLPNPDDMFRNNQAPWVLFNAWCETFLRANSDATIRHTYQHARTINRGDLPSFR